MRDLRFTFCRRKVYRGTKGQPSNDSLNLPRSVHHGCHDAISVMSLTVAGPLSSSHSYSPNVTLTNAFCWPRILGSGVSLHGDTRTLDPICGYEYPTLTFNHSYRRCTVLDLVCAKLLRSFSAYYLRLPETGGKEDNVGTLSLA